MRLLGKPVGALDASDIAALVANRVGESRTLDYKRDIVVDAPADRREFAKDLSAMANTAGGVLVYGLVTERDSNNKDLGIPVDVRGIGATVNVDGLTSTLTGIAKSIIAPSLAGQVRIQAVPVPNADGPVLFVGIPRSIAGPHRVEQGNNSYWRRADRDKYEPDITELRSMFLEADRWIDDAEEFRARRMRQVLEGGAVPGIDRSSSTFIQVLPLGRFRQVLDLKGPANRLKITCAPPRAHSWGDTFNAEGFALTAQSSSVIHAYTQWLRFGGVEGYSSHFVVSPRGGSEVRQLAIRQIEELLVSKWMVEALAAMRDILVQDPPYVVLMAVHGVRNAVVMVGTGNDRHECAEEGTHGTGANRSGCREAARRRDRAPVQKGRDGEAAGAHTGRAV